MRALPIEILGNDNPHKNVVGVSICMWVLESELCGRANHGSERSLYPY